MTAPAFPAAIRPLARTMTVAGSAAIVAMTMFVIAAFWIIASGQQRETSTRYAACRLGSAVTFAITETEPSLVLFPRN